MGVDCGSKAVRLCAPLDQRPGKRSAWLSFGEFALSFRDFPHSVL
jgi:hypothetical protein